ncbi:hypothetical protein FSP39_004383 [Pinctada imbricata]|uniref:Uncharacterized protein n=1 Tax=Pinctada imbricata TaxID=66713 RepID=A0AA89BWF4_PINIB|nr:hypothetical protein FSP39_004383 [Pinctada imbricata]
MFLPSNNFSSDQNCSLGEIKVLKLPNSVPGSTNGRSPRPLSQLIQSTPPFKPTHRRAYSAGACLQSLITPKPVEIDPPPAPHYPSYSSSGSSFTDGKGKITGIAISSDSTMYVINSTLKECHHFELDGRLLGTFRGTLKDPLDVAIYTDDDGVDVVLVTDHGESNHGIKVMKTDGDSGQRDFMVLTDHPIKPMGITVMPLGSEKLSGEEILTCDAEDKLIKVYNKQGESLRCIGQNYSTLFKWPLYMTIFKMKYLVITDNCLQTVFIIDMDTDNIIARIQHENFTPAKTCVLPDGSILIGDNSHTVAHKATTNILNERRKNREIQSTMMFSSEPIALAANKDFLCVGCKDGSIHAISMNATLSLVQKSEGTKEYFV